jgi:hypothetical protein
MSPTVALAASASRRAIGPGIAETPKAALVAWLVWSSSGCTRSWCTTLLVLVQTICWK